jgi:hypothetical protein
MYIVEIEATDWRDDRSWTVTKQFESLKEARKWAIAESWRICQAGIIPGKIFNALKHGIAVTEGRGAWMRFRSDDYWIKLGIDWSVLS